ncbi:MAG: hypothetical protein GY708_20090 [Actinomycetia bacterium]|nr:hypothetical protein [Actinomycetes bacterium]
MERGKRGPLLEALWWASNVWADATRMGDSVDVSLRVIGLEMPLSVVREQVVLGLSRAGLAGVPDEHLAPVLDAVLQAAGVRSQTEVESRRRFGLTKGLIGHPIAPLPGSHVGHMKVEGAILAPDNVWWGAFALGETDDELCPIGVFERRGGSGSGTLGVLSAVARMLPSNLLR